MSTSIAKFGRNDQNRYLWPKKGPSLSEQISAWIVHDGTPDRLGHVWCLPLVVRWFEVAINYSEMPLLIKICINIYTTKQIKPLMLRAFKMRSRHIYIYVYIYTQIPRKWLAECTRILGEALKYHEFIHECVTPRRGEWLVTWWSWRPANSTSRNFTFIGA